MKHQNVSILANGNCAVGRDCRDVHFGYADGTRIHYHGEYGNGSTVDPNDLAALARAAGASEITGSAVESDGRFITGFTEYSGYWSDDGYWITDYGLD